MALLAGVIISAQLAGVFLLSPENRDFGLSFHASGRAWIETGQPYGLEALPNLNPPIVTMTLFVPAAYLSLRAAAVLWTALGAISLALTWCWLVHRLSMGGHPRLDRSACCFAQWAPPASSGWKDRSRGYCFQSRHTAGGPIARVATGWPGSGWAC